MKYFAFAVVFTLAALMVKAQKTSPLLYTYKQKQLNDTLQMLFPDLRPSEEIQVQYNTPVLPLKNEATKIGSNNLGEIYSMNADRMPCLKSYKTKDEMPNTMKQKQLVPLLKPKENQ